VQIGLLPNTEWLEGTVELSPRGEVVIDDRGRTSVPGVFAAGDCTTVPYKQIVIAMGAGSTAALSAFDHLIRTHEGQQGDGEDRQHRGGHQQHPHGVVPQPRPQGRGLAALGQVVAFPAHALGQPLLVGVQDLPGRIKPGFVVEPDGGHAESPEAGPSLEGVEAVGLEQFAHLLGLRVGHVAQPEQQPCHRLPLWVVCHA
jgi:hypothetical protein